MMNIFSPFPPPPRAPDWKELPAAAAQPRCWKSLGHLHPGIEGRYGIAGYRGDMDVDREHDLRNEMAVMLRLLADNGAFDDSIVLVKADGSLVVRIARCDCAARALMARN